MPDRTGAQFVATNVQTPPIRIRVVDAGPSHRVMTPGDIAAAFSHKSIRRATTASASASDQYQQPDGKTIIFRQSQLPSDYDGLKSNFVGSASQATDTHTRI
ncbi:hypothetical protein OHD13_16535 [Escherichia coli]|uniref:hypothetical protein n=1 Tax=Escherichia coli TaxID=562 RepID=UPI002238F9F2|nr:hypothetical protein [Escherichia coli]MCW7229608.1 hypothetical protein [Escherichia coli]